MNYIMSHPILYSAVSSSPVIADFNSQLPGADLSPDSFTNPVKLFLKKHPIELWDKAAYSFSGQQVADNSLFR